MASPPTHRGRRFPGGAAALLLSLLLAAAAHPLTGPISPPVRAQESGGSAPPATVYLASGHPAYATLELFRGAGLLSGDWLDIRPLARHAVAGALVKGIARARERGLERLAAAGEWRLREFVPEAAGGNTAAAPDLPLPRSSPLRFDWTDGEAGLTAELTLELTVDGRNDIPPDYERALVGRGGIEVYGTAGRGIGYGARYRQSNETRAGTVRRWILDPGQTAALQSGFLDMVAYNESAGHLSFDGRYLGVDLGFDSPAWGPSPERNLLLSGHAPSFGYLQGRVVFGEWLRYVVLAGSLRSGIVDSLRSYRTAESDSARVLERPKYLIGHRLELHPSKRIQVGLQEMVIAADRFPDLVYTVPTVTLWDAQHYLDSPDNAMVQVDVSVQPERGPSLYAVLAIDEWEIADTFSDSTNHNWLAFQLGGSWTPPLDGGRWNVWVEATRILPNVYRHRFPVNDWTHWGSPLGFWSTQNSEVVQGCLSYLASARLQLALWGRYARKGGEVTRNEQYEIPPSEAFMLGAVRLGAWVGVRAVYEGEHHWQVTAEAVRAPAGLWPHDRITDPSRPASLGQEWQFLLRLAYNPF